MKAHPSKSRRFALLSLGAGTLRRAQSRIPILSPPAGIRWGKWIDIRTDTLEGRAGGRHAGALCILGVDPGSQATGYGVIEHLAGELRHVAHGVLRPPRGGSLARRLAALADALAEVIESHRPDVGSVEQVFVAASPRSALVLGQARGAALVALGAASIPVVEYAPARIKQSVTGSGRAPKAQMQRMVRRVLALQRTPPADAADALAAAICHAHAGRLEALEVRRPTRRRARVARVQVRGAR